MNTRRKLMIAAAAIGLPVVAWAASVEFRDFSDAGASIHVSGQMPGTVARLERSTDLVNWAPVDAESVAPDGTALLSYVNAPGQPRGFYRVAAEPAPRRGEQVNFACTEDQTPRIIEPETSPYTPILITSSPALATEGTPYPQLDTTISPTRVGNKLVIDVSVTIVGSGPTLANPGPLAVAALFQDNQPEAIAVTVESSGSGISQTLRLRHIAEAVSTQPTTFKIRLSNDHPNIPVNRTDNAPPFGQRIPSSMTIAEIQQ